MAKPDMTIKVDEFLTNTRIPFCAARICKFNGMQLRGPPGKEFQCNLKQVDLDATGQCKSYETHPDCE